MSSRIDETADKFERILDVIIEYADIETRLKRLGEEIQKTNRRVNALEQITVPALREQVAYIRQTLDERAREDLFRLKKVKKKIERKKAAGGARARGSRRNGAMLAIVDSVRRCRLPGGDGAASRCCPAPDASSRLRTCDGPHPGGGASVGRRVLGGLSSSSAMMSSDVARGPRRCCACGSRSSRASSMICRDVAHA